MKKFSEERFEQIVVEVLRWFDKAPPENQQEFLDAGNGVERIYSNMPHPTPRKIKGSLALYHHGFGTRLRNHFGLWEHKWEPEIRNHVDHSPEHPDNISGRIIEEVHRRANERNQNDS